MPPQNLRLRHNPRPFSRASVLIPLKLQSLAWKNGCRLIFVGDDRQFPVVRMFQACERYGAPELTVRRQEWQRKMSEGLSQGDVRGVYLLDRGNTQLVVWFAVGGFSPFPNFHFRSRITAESVGVSAQISFQGGSEGFRGCWGSGKKPLSWNAAVAICSHFTTRLRKRMSIFNRGGVFFSSLRYLKATDAIDS